MHVKMQQAVNTPKAMAIKPSSREKVPIRHRVHVRIETTRMHSKFRVMVSTKVPRASPWGCHIQFSVADIGTTATALNGCWLIMRSGGPWEAFREDVSGDLGGLRQVEKMAERRG